jgi:DNA mismatch repair ATPase MutS
MRAVRAAAWTAHCGHACATANSRLRLRARFSAAPPPAPPPPADAERVPTPAMRQYWTVKNDPQFEGCVVLFQMGGFYEAFYGDAAVMSRACGVVLTARGDVPMAGLPVDRMEGHVLKLLRRGHKVVLVDQAEAAGVGLRPHPFARSAYFRLPSTAARPAGLIKRSAVRILTPGTGADLLGSSHASSHYLAAVSLDTPTLALSPASSSRGLSLAVGLAWADVSTGEFFVREVDSRALAAELSSISPAELLLPSMSPDLRPSGGVEGTEGSLSIELIMRMLRPEACRVLADVVDQRQKGTTAAPTVVRLTFPGGDSDGAWVTCLPVASFSNATAEAQLASLALHSSGEVAGPGRAAERSLTRLERSAAGGLLRYLSWSLCGSTPPRLSAPVSLTIAGKGKSAQVEAPSPSPVPVPQRFVRFPVPARLRLNEATQRAMELVRPTHGRRRARGSLLDLIDCCRSHMGSRLLDSRLVRPLASLLPLLHRHDAVEALCGPRISPAGMLRTALREGSGLGAVPDIERCFMRLSGARVGGSSVSAQARDLQTVRDGLKAARAVGLLLSRGSPSSTGMPDEVARETAVASACAALGCSSAELPGLLLASVPTELDVVWDASAGPLQSGAPLPCTAQHVLSQSYVLAQCAALLTAPLVPSGESSASGAPFNALARAHMELEGALLPSTSRGSSSSTNAVQVLPASEGDAVEMPSPPSSAPGASLPPGSVVRSGYSAELDEARTAASSTNSARQSLEAALRTYLGLLPSSPALRVRGSAGSGEGGGRASDGLYVEVDVRARPNRRILDAALARQAGEMAAAAEAESVQDSAPRLPASLRAKAVRKPGDDLLLRPIRSTETLKRFRCDALSRLEVNIVEASARAEGIEGRIIAHLASLVATAEEAVKAMARAIAVLDVTAAMAELAERHTLVRPMLTEVGVPVRLRGAGGVADAAVGAGELVLRDARHLIVEQAVAVWHPAAAAASMSAAAANAGTSPAPLQEAEEADSWLQDGLLPAADLGRKDSSAAASYPRPSQHPRHASFVPNDIVLGAPPSAVASDAWDAAWAMEGPQVNGTPTLDLRGLASARCVLLLGPNMGGKSTYLRTAAQAVVLAQVGAFVPASEARMGITDAIFCRVGASDDLAGHRSTFRVEMEEMGEILANATSSSLVIVDEVGRGTAVGDGLALSAAVLEDLSLRVGARTLFATHFPELAAAALPSLLGADGGQGVSVRAMFMEWVPCAPLAGGEELEEEGERRHSILVTHRVRLHPIHAAAASGMAVADLVALLGTSVSHGLSVAAHAGLPPRVVQRAGHILSSLQKADVPAAWARAVMEAAAPLLMPR